MRIRWVLHNFNSSAADTFGVHATHALLLLTPDVEAEGCSNNLCLLALSEHCTHLFRR